MDIQASGINLKAINIFMIPAYRGKVWSMEKSAGDSNYLIQGLCPNNPLIYRSFCHSLKALHLSSYIYIYIYMSDEKV